MLHWLFRLVGLFIYLPIICYLDIWLQLVTFIDCWIITLHLLFVIYCCDPCYLRLGYLRLLYLLHYGHCCYCPYGYIYWFVVIVIVVILLFCCYSHLPYTIYLLLFVGYLLFVIYLFIVIVIFGLLWIPLGCYVIYPICWHCPFTGPVLVIAGLYLHLLLLLPLVDCIWLLLLLDLFSYCYLLLLVVCLIYLVIYCLDYYVVAVFIVVIVPLYITFVLVILIGLFTFIVCIYIIFIYSIGLVILGCCWFLGYWVIVQYLLLLLFIHYCTLPGSVIGLIFVVLQLLLIITVIVTVTFIVFICWLFIYDTLYCIYWITGLRFYLYVGYIYCPHCIWFITCSYTCARALTLFIVWYITCYLRCCTFTCHLLLHCTYTPFTLHWIVRLHLRYRVTHLIYLFDHLFSLCCIRSHIYRLQLFDHLPHFRVAVTLHYSCTFTYGWLLVTLLYLDSCSVIVTSYYPLQYIQWPCYCLYCCSLLWHLTGIYLYWLYYSHCYWTVVLYYYDPWLTCTTLYTFWTQHC